MSYTVKELANLSGVSVRTLHYYDQIGLLKPAYHGNNGYRYYEEEQLLLLQQILFFRELDFELQQIQRILGKGNFDKLSALTEHKKRLMERSERLKALVQTIDQTIQHLKGNIKMKGQELYAGFSKEQQKKYEEYLIEQASDEEQMKKLIDESLAKTKHWKKADWERFQAAHDAICKELVEAIEAGQSPASVQKVIGRHYALISQFYTPNKELYIGLGTLYLNHVDFRKKFDAFHPQLAEFLAEAMKLYIS